MVKSIPKEQAQQIHASLYYHCTYGLFECYAPLFRDCGAARYLSRAGYSKVREIGYCNSVVSLF